MSDECIDTLDRQIVSLNKQIQSLVLERAVLRYEIAKIEGGKPLFGWICGVGGCKPISSAEMNRKGL